jgi:hypothetical protein
LTYFTILISYALTNLNLAGMQTGFMILPRLASRWRDHLQQHDRMKILHHVAAVLCGIALTILFHRYTVLSGFDLVQTDPGDSRIIASILEHWSKVLRGVDYWESPPWFFPLGGTLGYSDVLFGMAIPYLLFRAFGAGTFVALNLTVVLLSYLSYLACLWLLRGVLAFHWWASLAGAAFFTFNYPKAAQLAHMQLRFDVLQPIVLGLLLSLVVSREMPSRLRTFVTCLGAALAFAVLASTTFLNAWFVMLLVFVSLTIALVVRELRLQLFWLLRHRWLAACSGLFLGSLALLPLMRLYLPAMAETGGWPWSEVLGNIPRPAQLIWMGTDSFIWGRLAALWPGLDGANWPEMRLGYGAVATLAWAALVAFSAVRLTRRMPLTADHEPPPRCVARLVAVLLVASLAIVLLGIQINGRSLWYLPYRLLPGGVAVRGVSRYVLTLSLPLAIGFAYALDRFLARPRSKVASAAVAATALVVGVEQLALIKYMYSANAVEQFEASIADMVDRRCAAFYLKPTRNHALARPQIDINSVTEQTFDAKAYLAANPDVAQNWKGSALEHFIKHGKNENRNLNPAEAPLNGHYQLTASLAALAAGVPTVNGISGKAPPGWDLMGVFGRDIGERMDNWMLRNRRSDKVCLIEHDLDGSEIRNRMSAGFFRAQ